jgi:hypothetical protein
MPRFFIHVHRPGLPVVVQQRCRQVVTKLSTLYRCHAADALVGAALFASWVAMGALYALALHERR